MKKRKRKPRCTCIHILALITLIHLLRFAASSAPNPVVAALADHSLAVSPPIGTSIRYEDESNKDSEPDDLQLKPISADPDDLLAVESSISSKHLSNSLKTAPYEVQVPTSSREENRSVQVGSSKSQVQHISLTPFMFAPQVPARERSGSNLIGRKLPQNSYQKWPSLAESKNESARKSVSDRRIGPEEGRSGITQFPPSWTSNFAGSSSAGEREDDFERVSLSAGQYQRTRPSGEASWAQLLRQATESNVMESLMVTNRSMVSLLCETNDMLVKLRFRQPFNGSVITNLDRLSQCRLDGDGRQYYEMRVSLHDCGTRQEMPRLFINNIRIHYRLNGFQSATSLRAPSLLNLTLEEDEMKTIVCSYPIRPRAPPPPPPSGLPERIVEQTSQVEEPARLVHYEPLVLIASLLLVTLTVLSLTTGAYLVAQRVRRRRLSAGGARRDPDSASIVSSRLYRNSPARVANLAVPPLIGFGKTKPFDIKRSRMKRYPQLSTGDTWREPSSSIARNDANKLQDRADSLRGGSSSVSTVEIPPAVDVLAPATIADQKLSMDRHFSNSLHKPARAAGIDPAQPETVKSYTLDRQTRSKTINVTYINTISKPKLEKESSATSNRAVSGSQLPKFGSLRSSLTSPKEFKRLQAIVDMFDEIVIEKEVDSLGNEVLVDKRRLKPSKYQEQLSDILDLSERSRLRRLLNQDELFRSSVVESTSADTFSRKLRNNPTYSNQLSPQAWDLFERILLDPQIGTTSVKREVSQRGTYTRWRKRVKPSITLETSQDREADAEVLAILAHDDNLVGPERLGEQRAPQPLDSLEFDLKPTDNISAGSRAIERRATSAETKSVLRVSQSNNTRSSSSAANSRGTTINMDSATSFASDLHEFSTYTRIRHTRYDQEDEFKVDARGPETDSLPYMDEKTDNN